MTYLLDVSTLLAWLWADHEHHQRVIHWQKGKSIAVWRGSRFEIFSAYLNSR